MSYERWGNYSMSNRDSLRALSKKMPPTSEVASIIDALKQDSDRTAAIVAASLLESTLEKMLISRFHVRNKDFLSRLFNNRGPAADFNSKILIAQAFGVISPTAADEFQAVRHIRNAFAHARVEVTFETPEVAHEVQRFQMLMAMKKVEETQIGGTKWGDKPPKLIFLLMVELLLILHDKEYNRPR
jgi:hypothetical protein